MVVTFEIAPPFRRHLKVEKVGPLTRLIWAWFSVAYISGKFGSVGDAFREDERMACAAVCRDRAKFIETAARRIAKDEPDEVPALLSTAWQLSVVECEILKRSNV